jgi:DNA helicase IV
VRVAAGDVAAAIGEIVGRGVAHNVGRAALRTQLTRLVRRELAARRGDEVGGHDGVDVDLRVDRSWQRAVDRLWPALSAPALVRRLLSSPTALRVAAAGVLGQDEQRLLLRKATPRAEDEPWTEADLVLVDEASALITGPPRAYAHVVVDEAQDLSAMAMRALARRCPARSMTVLGDLAQATAPAAQRSWPDAVAHLGGPANARVVELAVGYRVPGPIIELANRLLPVAAPHVRPGRSVRVAGREPVFERVQPDELGATTAALIVERAARWTSVGVIVPDDLRAEVDAELAAGEGLPDHVLVVAPDEAKGLEFDAVLVVEPAAIAGATAAGLRLLYVALTRAVQELVVVHTRPLPAALIPAS